MASIFHTSYLLWAMELGIPIIVPFGSDPLGFFSY